MALEVLTVQSLVEETGCCQGCVMNRVCALEVVEASKSANVDPREIRQRYVGFISLCPREVPVPPPADPDRCSTMNPERKCLHEDLVGPARAQKMQEIVGS